MQCKIAAAQISIRKRSYEKSIEDAQVLIHEAAKKGAQIVCLPEHWLLEFWKQANDLPERIAETAKSEGVFVITGANYTHYRSTVRIQSILIGPAGQIVGRQDKVHLFRDERTIAVPGRKYKVLETPLGNLGVTICYDNVFPEAARTITLQGADLLFVPSRIITEGLEAWLLYLKTRALENRIPVIAPNVFDPPRHSGGSVIIDLEESPTSPVILPKVVASAKMEETVIVANVNVEEARRLRLKRLLERKPSAYVISKKLH